MDVTKHDTRLCLKTLCALKVFTRRTLEESARDGATDGGRRRKETVIGCEEIAVKHTPARPSSCVSPLLKLPFAHLFVCALIIA